MATPFIVRFQEACVDTENTGSGLGTETITNVRVEQMDSDPDRFSYGVLGQRGIEAGTMTRTAVRAEQSDEDREFSPLSVIPMPKATPSLGTQTLTKIRAEGADEDPGRRQFRAIPQCFSS
jgi:hypothetical protein